MANAHDIRVSNTLVKSLLFYIGHSGISLEEALKKTSLSEKSLQDADGLVSLKDYEQVFLNGLSLTKDPFFGIHLGGNFSLQQIGVIGYLLMNSDNFSAALKSYQQFQTALGESIVLSITTSGSIARVVVDFLGSNDQVGHQAVEAFISAIKSSGRELTGRELKILKVGLQYEPTKPVSEYLKIIDVVPERNGENFFEFSSDYMKLPIVNSSPELITIFENQLSQKISPSFSRNVRRELMKRIGKDSINTVEELSIYFGMSERNFQLKLEQEKTSFREIHEQVQAEFALRYLKAGSPIAEIAYALGFSEPSAFQRAYKRWTGMTPGQAREKA